MTGEGSVADAPPRVVHRSSHGVPVDPLAAAEAVAVAGIRQRCPAAGAAEVVAAVGGVRQQRPAAAAAAAAAAEVVTVWALQRCPATLSEAAGPGPGAGVLRQRPAARAGAAAAAAAAVVWVRQRCLAAVAAAWWWLK